MLLDKVPAPLNQPMYMDVSEAANGYIIHHNGQRYIAETKADVIAIITKLLSA